MLINLSNNQILASQIGQAYTFLGRLKGLMFTKELPTGCALHIRPCRSVHTFFMNYSIDVLYLNADLKIVAIDEQLRPGKVGPIYADAVSVIELPAGAARQTETQIGHFVQLRP
ncbi:DUF192 domain-containing protein [Brevibacillus sp. SYSU BS000544]|uniref:DUF192 domain-containing protein n=1 Tax=Brevibacillus sp. SYSU BS000544 TaxID=3416443 RepID=UPI003CE4F74F